MEINMQQSQEDFEYAEGWKWAGCMLKHYAPEEVRGRIPRLVSQEFISGMRDRVKNEMRTLSRRLKNGNANV